MSAPVLGLIMAGIKGSQAAQNGHPDLAILGAVSGVAGTVLGGYAALNAFFSKRAKVDAVIRDSLRAIRDVLAAVKATPDRHELLNTTTTKAHIASIEDNLGQATSLRLRWMLRRLVSKFHEAAGTPPPTTTGQGGHALVSKVEAAYRLACKSLDRLDALVRRSPT